MTISDLVVFDVSSDVAVSKSFSEAAANLQDSVENVPISEAFSIVDGALMSGLQYTQGSLLYTVHAIGLAKLIWDKLDTSQKDVIADTFYQYVGNRFGVSQNPSTVDNYIRVAKTWLLKDTKVEVPSVQAVVTIEDGTPKIATEEKRTDVWEVPFSKLLVAIVKADREEMKEEDWGLLFNPKVSQGQLIDYWQGPKEPGEKPNDVLSYAVYAGHLCAVRGKEIEDMAEVDLFSINNDGVAKEGWQRLMSILKVEMMDDSLVIVEPDEEDF